MSGPRFAAITASLLARKGEAQPWAEPDKQPLSWDGTLDGMQRRFDSPPPPLVHPLSPTPPSLPEAEPPPKPRAARAPEPLPHIQAPAPSVPVMPPPVAAVPERAPSLPRATELLRQPSPAARAELETVHAGDCKKCTVRMSHHDYERLGILAVKQGKTRQRLLQEAVDDMLSGITRAFGGGCACLKDER